MNRERKRKLKDQHDVQVLMFVVATEPCLDRCLAEIGAVRLNRPLFARIEKASWANQSTIGVFVREAIEEKLRAIAGTRPKDRVMGDGSPLQIQIATNRGQS